MKNKKSTSAETLEQARSFNRRVLLKAAAAGAALSASGPWIVRDAFSSSGEINILHWPDEIPDPMFAEFTKKTGIQVNSTPFAQNEEMVNKLQATGGDGFDLCMPSLPWAPQMKDLDLLSPWDTNKLPMDKFVPSLLDRSKQFWIWDDGLYHLPHCWGSEGIAWRTDLTNIEYKDASYGMLWDEKYKGKTQGRPWSMLLQIGLWWDHTGKLPSDRMYDTFKSEEGFKRVYDQILPFAIEHKAWVRQFWDSGDLAVSGFMENGCVIGECWDGPALRMAKQGQPIGYIAPQEGIMSWIDGWGLLKAAQNIPQVYEWIAYLTDPKVAATVSNKSGYNSVIAGAEEFVVKDQKELFDKAYPGNAIDNMWIQVPAEPWYLKLRAQYACPGSAPMAQN